MNWAEEVLRAVERILASDPTTDPTTRVSVVDHDSIAIIFRAGEAPRIRGIRLDESSVRNGPYMFRRSSIDDLAVYLVHAGSEEPRAPEEFSAPDEHGVAWLDTYEWMADVSCE